MAESMTEHSIDYFGLGIDRYPEWKQTNICSDLDYAASDCERIRDTLQEIGFLGTTEVITDAQPRTRPVRNEVYRGINRFIRNSTREKPKIFYFAGHGVSIRGALNICAADFDHEIADKAGVDISEIVLKFCESSPWSLFILDCCRAPLKSEGSNEFSVQFGGGGIRILDNSIVMFSCSHGEQSYEAASIGGLLGGGIFTHFLCKGLLHFFKRNRRSRIALSQLFTYARDLTAEYALEQTRTQTPRMIGAQGTDFFLVR
jgi:uncharacterized caspase-like protein